MDKKNNWAWGVPGITFIWHGQWADPEVEYKDFVFNYIAKVKELSVF